MISLVVWHNMCPNKLDWGNIRRLILLPPTNTWHVHLNQEDYTLVLFANVKILKKYLSFPTRRGGWSIVERLLIDPPPLPPQKVQHLPNWSQNNTGGSDMVTLYSHNTHYSHSLKILKWTSFNSFISIVLLHFYHHHARYLAPADSIARCMLQLEKPTERTFASATHC